MPLRKDLKSILIIGSGPIVIGQAAEFDYSGTQACQALREEGVFSGALGPKYLRLVTHMDVSTEQIEIAATKLVKILG